MNNNFENPKSYTALWSLRALLGTGIHRELNKRKGFVPDDVYQTLGISPEQASLSDFDLPKELEKQHAKAESKAYGETLVSKKLKELAIPLALSDLEVDILHLMVIHDLDGGFKKCMNLYQEVSMTDFYELLGLMLKKPFEKIHQALLPNATLNRSGLLDIQAPFVAIGESSNFDNYSTVLGGLSFRLTQTQTRGLEIFDHYFKESDVFALPLSAFEHFQPQLGLIKAYISAGKKSNQKGINILLHGVSGAGKSTLAKSLATDVGLKLYEVANATEDGLPMNGRTRLRSLKLAQTVLLNDPDALILFDEIEDVFGRLDYGDMNDYATDKRNVGKAYMNRMIESNFAPTLWATNRIHAMDPAHIRRFDMSLKFEVPPVGIRRKVLEHYLKELGASEKWISKTAQHSDLTPAIVEKASRIAKVLLANGTTQNIEIILEQIIDSSLQSLSCKPLSSVSKSFSSEYNFELLNAKTDLQKILGELERNHVGARLCLHGPSGCGKSHFARYLSKQLERPLIVKTGAQLLGKYVGQTEEQLAQAFDEAETSKGILLIDEVDAFLTNRDNTTHSWEVSAVNEFLVLLERYEGLFVATTNRLKHMDPAVLRRFDLKVEFGYLNSEQIKALWAQSIQRLGFKASQKVPHSLLNLECMTPGDFATIERQARFNSISDVQELEQRFLMECAHKPNFKSLKIGFH